MKLQEYCTSCSKPLVGLAIESTYKWPWRNPLRATEFVRYDKPCNRCNPATHHYSEWQEQTPRKPIYSIDGTKQAYEYQLDFLEVFKECNCNCILGDDMGIGKTMQAILAAKENSLLPCLIITKSGVVSQIANEVHTWHSNKFTAVLPIIGTPKLIPPGFDFYIISMDTMNRQSKGEFKTANMLAKMGFKLVVIDECHSFKDDDSLRNRSLVHLITEGNIPHRLPMSGTPIKNRAGEWFTALNLVQPQIYSYRAQFEREWLTDDNKRIRFLRLKEFQEQISPFFIRRTKAEVMQWLPPKQRNEIWIELDDPIIKKAYNSEIDLFSNFLNSEGKLDSMSLLGWLARFRHIVGRGKVPFVLDRALEFLDVIEGEKLAIGTEHNDVRDAFYNALVARNIKALKLSGENNAQSKNDILAQFRNGNNPLVINTKSGGEGLNIEFCSNIIVCEQGWTYSGEVQFEDRFYRNGQKNKVIVDYVLAKGTIDEFLYAKRREKQGIHNESVDYQITNDSAALKDIAEQVIAGRL